MLPVNYWSWQPLFSTKKATKKLKIVMLPVILLPITVENHSSQSYLKHGRRYVSDQLWSLPTVPFREAKNNLEDTIISFNYQNRESWLTELPKTWKTICFLQTCKLSELLNKNTSKWLYFHSSVVIDNRSIQSYLITGRHFTFSQLLGLSILVFRVT